MLFRSEQDANVTGREVFAGAGWFQCDQLLHVFIGDKQGMIDKNGKAFIPVKYDSLGVFSENMIVTKCGNPVGMVDMQGLRETYVVWLEILS